MARGSIFLQQTGEVWIKLLHVEVERQKCTSLRGGDGGGGGMQPISLENCVIVQAK